MDMKNGLDGIKGLDDVTPEIPLARLAMRGGIWFFAMKVAHRSLGLVRTVILARLLSPGDFGLFGIAAFTIDFLENCSVTGVDMALVQKKDDIKGYLDTAWTINIIRSSILFMALYFGAPMVASFFNTPSSLEVVRALAFVQLFIGLENSATVYFQREIRIDRIFIWRFGGTVVNVAVSIAAAFIVRSVWALVWGALAGAFTKTVLSFVLRPYWPKLRIDPAKTKELLNFGKWLFGSSLLIFFITQGDDAFVGKVLGVAALGFYQMAYNLSNAPATEIGNFVAQITFPVYSRMQDDMPRLREAYLKIFQLIAFLSFPMAGLIFVLAPEFTLVFLGQKWMPIVPVMRILSVWGLVRAIEATTTQIFYATGQPAINARLKVLQLALIAAGIYPLTMKWGIAGAAISVTAAGFLPNAIALWITVRKVGSDMYQFGKMMLLPAINTALMLAVVCALRGRGTSIVMFFVSASAGALVYVAVANLFNFFFGYDIWYIIRRYRAEFKGDR